MIRPIALLSLLMFSAPSFADPISLDWKLEKGTTFYSKSVTKLEQTISVAGMNMEQNNESTTFQQYSVIDKDSEGNTTIEQTILKAENSGNLPIGDISGNMKGAKLQFVLDKNMKVTKLIGHKEYVEKISGGMNEAAQMLRSTIGEDALKISIGDLFSTGPGMAVKKGDNWKRETKVPLGPLGDFTVNAKYTLDSSEGDVAKVGYVGDATFTLGKGGEGLPFTFSKGELKADDLQGTIEFDVKKGRLTTYSQSMKMSGAMTIAVNGMEIEMTLKSAQKTNTSFSDTKMIDD